MKNRLDIVFGATEKQFVVFITGHGHRYFGLYPMMKKKV